MTPATRINATNRALRRAAKQSGAGIVDFHSALARAGGASASLSTDGVHLTQAGYRLLAKSVAAALPRKVPGRVLCFGDSLTFGIGVRAIDASDAGSDSCPQQLKRNSAAACERFFRKRRMPRMAVLVAPGEREREIEAGVEESLARLLASPQFARAETQRRLLQYLWERRQDVISEYAIATEALGRKSHFDSNSDASVRVHISRLRRKLKDYYAETGKAELLAIPTGTHRLTILEHHLIDIPAELPLAAQPPPSVATWLRAKALPLLIGLCIVLAIGLSMASILLVRQTRKVHTLAANLPARRMLFGLASSPELRR